MLEVKILKIKLQAWPCHSYKESFYSNDEMNPAKSPVGERGVFDFVLGKYKIKLSTRQMPEKCSDFLIDAWRSYKENYLHRVYHKQFYAKLQSLLPEEIIHWRYCCLWWYLVQIFCLLNNLLRVLHNKE